ncbi:MAG TPA: alpha/beta hydrolase [Anaerolineales bacterium]|nr:alpha/beta hydrolase [Anaerolineales bacterium]
MIREDALQAAGLQIHFYECGSSHKDSLLFVHGWASSGRMWHETMSAMSDEWRCLAPDLPGHGQSDKPPFSWYSVSNFAEAIGAWADQLGGLPRVAVGHSLGGAVVVELAMRHPQRLGRIVLVNPVVSGRVSYNLHALSGRVPRQTILDLGRRVWPRARAHLLRRAARGGAGARMKEYLQRNLQDLAQTTADSVLGSARAAIHHDLTDHMAGLTLPVLVVVGTHDTTVPPEEGRRLVRCAQQAQLVELDAGHLPTDEQPQAFVSALRTFLRSGTV